MTRHASRIRPIHRQQLQHRQQETRDLLALLLVKVVLLVQDVWQRPVAQAVNVTQLALTVEYLLTPFSRQAERFGECAEQLDDLRDVVVVFAVFCAGLGVEEIVACYQLEGLPPCCQFTVAEERVG